MVKRVIEVVLAILLFTTVLDAQTISGVVKDALIDKPIKDAKVTIFELKKVFTTNASGMFWTDSIKPGTYSLRFEADGYLKHSKKVILKSKKEVGSSHIMLNLKLYSLASSADKSKGRMAVKYFFPGHGHVNIVIYDDDGQKIRKAFDRTRRGGIRTYHWDGKDNRGKPVPVGLYTCRISCGTMVMNRELDWKGKN